MTTLKELVVGKHTDKDTLHSYIDVYDQYLLSRKESAKQILEIGIYQGGSILMWQEYFKNAEITGVDISFQNNMTDLNVERITLKKCDAYSDAVVTELAARKYDVIVDDGPHTLESMLYVAKYYTHLLSEKGILIIEDIQEMGWIEKIVDAFPEHLRNMVEIVDRREIKGRYDDVLVILDLRSAERS